MRRLPAALSTLVIASGLLVAVSPARAIVPATPTTLASISASVSTTLVVGPDGRPYGVGANGSGQLTGTGGRTQLTPLEGLGTGVTAVAVSAGFEHSVVIGSDGVPYATGRNASHEITGADTASRTTLTPMTGLPPGVTAAQAHASRWSNGTLVIGSDGVPYVVGSNEFDKLGGSFTTLTALPGWPDDVAAVDGEITYGNLFVVGDDGSLYARGYNPNGQGPGPVGTGSDTLVAMFLPTGVEATAVEASDGSTFIIGDDGVAYGQGDNQGGEIGYGSDVSNFHEVGTNTDGSSRLPAGTRVVQVAAGTQHAVLLLSDGRIHGTGQTNLGQLPSADTSLSRFELQELGGSLAGDVTSVVAGDYTTLVADHDGIAYGSGRNLNGQIGGPSESYAALHVLAGQALTNRTPPTISGVPQLTRTLTADPGTWAPTSAGFTYQWTVGGLDIAGATARTYAPAAERIGDPISVRVTASRGRLASASATSTPTLPVAKGPAPVYAHPSKPTITGTRRSGQTLRISKNAASLRAGFAPDAASITYQWYRSGAKVAGRTGATYRLGTADRGRSVQVRIHGSLANHATGSYVTRSVRIAK